MDMEKFKQMSCKDIGDLFGFDHVSILSPDRSIPHILYWKGGPETRTLGEELERGKRPESWMLVGHPTINPRSDSKLLTVIIDGEYIPPGRLQFTQVSDLYEGVVIPPMIDSYNISPEPNI